MTVMDCECGALLCKEDSCPLKEVLIRKQFWFDWRWKLLDGTNGKAYTRRGAIEAAVKSENEGEKFDPYKWHRVDRGEAW